MAWNKTGDQPYYVVECSGPDPGESFELTVIVTRLETSLSSDDLADACRDALAGLSGVTVVTAKKYGVDQTSF